METLMTRVQKILQKEFSRREIRLKSAGKGKIDGFIISKSFEKLADERRYQKVWNLIDTHLNEKDRNRVLGFFLLTPLEEKWIFDGSTYDQFDAALKKKPLAAKKKTAAKRANGRAGTIRAKRTA